MTPLQSDLIVIFFISSYLVWPVLFPVTTVERRSRSTWRCPGLLRHPPGSTLFTYNTVFHFLESDSLSFKSVNFCCAVWPSIEWDPSSVAPPFFSQYVSFSSFPVEGLRSEYVARCRDYKAHWGNVIEKAKLTFVCKITNCTKNSLDLFEFNYSKFLSWN